MPKKVIAGAVYIAWDQTKPTRCKVGFSAGPVEKRIANSRTSNPDYVLFGSVKSQFAKPLEKVSHAFLITAGVTHISGEWFELSPQDALRVVELLEWLTRRVYIRHFERESCLRFLNSQISRDEFLLEQRLFSRAAKRREKAIHTISQFQGRNESKRLFPIKVWAYPTENKGLRTRLARLLQMFRQNVPVSERKIWKERNLLFTVSEEFQRQTILHKKKLVEAQQLKDYISNVIARCNHSVMDSETASLARQLILLRANHAMIDPKVLALADEVRVRLDTVIPQRGDINQFC